MVQLMSFFDSHSWQVAWVVVYKKMIQADTKPRNQNASPGDSRPFIPQQKNLRADITEICEATRDAG
jgi:hypothetical protein